MIWLVQYIVCLYQAQRMQMFKKNYEFVMYTVRIFIFSAQVMNE